MSANLKWTKQQELELINDVASGKNLEIYSQKHNRSLSAIDLRLKKIIYEAYVSGKSLQTISQLLKLHIDKVTQCYYAYKEFKEKRGGIVEGSTITNTKTVPDMPAYSHQIHQVQQSQPSQVQQQVSFVQQPQSFVSGAITMPPASVIAPSNSIIAPSNSIITPSNIPIATTGNDFVQLGGAKVIDDQIAKAFGEPNNLDKIETKLRKLEVENRILKLIVENKDLTHQLNKLISEKKVDPSIKQLIKVVRKATK